LRNMEYSADKIDSLRSAVEVIPVSDVLLHSLLRESVNNHQDDWEPCF
jgi:hypothetical protein